MSDVYLLQGADNSGLNIVGPHASVLTAGLSPRCALPLTVALPDQDQVLLTIQLLTQDMKKVCLMASKSSPIT